MALEYTSGGISDFFKSVQQSITQLSGTGVAVIQARQQVRNALADARNSDAVNVAIAASASPNPATEAARAYRDGVTAALTTGADGNGLTKGVPPLLIVGGVVLLWLLLK